MVEGGGGEVAHAGAEGFFADDEEERAGVGGGEVGEGVEDGMGHGGDAGFRVDGAAAADEDGGFVEG